MRNVLIIFVLSVCMVTGVLGQTPISPKIHLEVSDTMVFDAANNNTLIIPEFLKNGAHWNSLTHPKENGYSSQWDSADDQFSIKCGFMHAKQNRYNSIKDQRATK